MSTMKKVFCVLVSALLFSTPASAGWKTDLALAGGTAITGYYGVRCFMKSRELTSYWHQERTVLLYNYSMSQEEWSRRYDARVVTQHRANEQFIYGTSLIVVSGALAYLLVKSRFSVAKRRDKGLTLSVKF